jgi:methylated-DNA-protein-cysteine methyltransferase-like protein
LKNDFYQRVYAVVAQIPYGKVTSYGAIARFLGAGKSSRMVGYALKSSLSIANLPAHRVLNRNGLLTGKHYFGGSTVMEDLLRAEGLPVVNDQVQNLEKHFWDPAEHLQPHQF